MVTIKYIWICPNDGYVEYFGSNPVSHSGVCKGPCGGNFSVKTITSLAVGVVLS